MISVQSAKTIVSNSVESTKNYIEIKTKDAIGHVLFEDLYSSINMPPFRQSAMDGYAVHIHNKNKYSLVGEVKAGDSNNPKLIKGEAVRIFTGAAVPDSSNAVVMQEKVERTGDNSIIINSQIKLQENIRALGEQIKGGDIALKKNTKLSASGVGYLLSLGITEVKVFQKPSIGIIVTGNELIEPGENLLHGQIYESNGAMLNSALSSLGFTDINQYTTKDDYKNTISVIKEALLQNDLILISGGISVGDYDFVGKALQELDVEQLFYKVKQKPGKPLFFGKTIDAYVFALPGNPASALSCFYNYVYIALNQLCGDFENNLIHLKANSLRSYSKKGDRAQFLKAFYKNNHVEILDGQASSMLNSFSISNAFVFIPENIIEIKKGDELEVILIPQY